MKHIIRISLLDEYVIATVRKKREEAKMSSAELSARMEVNENFVAAVESRSMGAKYNLSHLNKLAEILNCAIADFLPNPYLKDENSK